MEQGKRFLGIVTGWEQSLSQRRVDRIVHCYSPYEARSLLSPRSMPFSHPELGWQRTKSDFSGRDETDQEFSSRLEHPESRAKKVSSSVIASDAASSPALRCFAEGTIQEPTVTADRSSLSVCYPRASFSSVSRPRYSAAACSSRGAGERPPYGPSSCAWRGVSPDCPARHPRGQGRGLRPGFRVLASDEAVSTCVSFQWVPPCPPECWTNGSKRTVLGSSPVFGR